MEKKCVYPELKFSQGIKNQPKHDFNVMRMIDNIIKFPYNIKITVQTLVLLTFFCFIITGTNAQTITGVNIIQPAKTTVLLKPGDPATAFTASATGGAATAYEWYVDGELQIGSTSANFSFPTPAVEGVYSVYAAAVNAVTGSNTARSIEITVIVVDDIFPPCTAVSGISINASSGSANVGTQVTLTATSLTPSGATNVSYIWEVNTPAGWMPLATTSTSTHLATIVNVGNNQFRVTATNSCTASPPSATTIVQGLPVDIVGGSAARITWEPASATYPAGRYIITYDPRDAGLYFKFGGVLGVYSDGDGKNKNLTPPASSLPVPFSASVDLPWSLPAVNVVDWTSVPYTHPTEDINAAYHTVANVKAGKGDPCRLVGLNLADIADNGNPNPVIDNGVWRLPTYAENGTFTGTGWAAPYSDHWWAENAAGNISYGVAGGEFPKQNQGGMLKFLPAAGVRNSLDGRASSYGSQGSYWSSVPEPGFTTTGYAMHFQSIAVWWSGANQQNAYPVRCVYTTPPTFRLYYSEGNTTYGSTTPLIPTSAIAGPTTTDTYFTVNLTTPIDLPTARFFHTYNLTSMATSNQVWRISQIQTSSGAAASLTTEVNSPAAYAGASVSGIRLEVPVGYEGVITLSCGGTYTITINVAARGMSNVVKVGETFTAAGVEWRLLAKNSDGSNALVIAEKIQFDCRVHDVTSNWATNIRWAGSRLRNILNGIAVSSPNADETAAANWYNARMSYAAFASAINPVALKTKIGQLNTYLGYDTSLTTEKFFLLSQEEVFNTCNGDDGDIANNLFAGQSLMADYHTRKTLTTGSSIYCWCRSSQNYIQCPLQINITSGVNWNTYDANAAGVRPAVCLNLNTP